MPENSSPTSSDINPDIPSDDSPKPSTSGENTRPDSPSAKQKVPTDLAEIKKTVTEKLILKVANGVAKAAQMSPAWKNLHNRVVDGHQRELNRIFNKGPAIETSGLGRLGAVVENQLPNFDYDDEFIAKTYNKLYSMLREWSRSFYCNDEAGLNTLKGWVKNEGFQEYEESYHRKKKLRRYFIESIVASALNKWVFEAKAIAGEQQMKKTVDDLERSLSDLKVIDSDVKFWRALTFRLLLRSNFAVQKPGDDSNLTNNFESLFDAVKGLKKDSTAHPEKSLREGLDILVSEALNFSLILQAQRATFILGEFRKDKRSFRATTMEDITDTEGTDKTVEFYVFPGLIKKENGDGNSADAFCLVKHRVVCMPGVLVVSS